MFVFIGAVLFISGLFVGIFVERTYTRVSDDKTYEKFGRICADAGIGLDQGLSVVNHMQNEGIRLKRVKI